LLGSASTLCAGIRPIGGQIIFTTHSPPLGKRNEAQRCGVRMDKGETIVKKPSETQVTDFFKS
jgi:hypothetical protein